MALGLRATLAYRNAVRQQMIAGGMSLAEALRKCNFATIPSDALEDALNEVSNTLSIRHYRPSRRKPSWPAKWGRAARSLHRYSQRLRPSCKVRRGKPCSRHSCNYCSG